MTNSQKVFEITVLFCLFFTSEIIGHFKVSYYAVDLIVFHSFHLSSF